MITSRRLSLLPLVGVVLSAACSSPEPGWPQWGGPNRNFHANSAHLANSWPEGGPEKIWSRPLGPGYSAIAVAGDRLVTTYRKGEEDVVAALHKDTGKTVWQHAYSAPVLPDQVTDWGTGPNSSPLVLGDRVVSIGFSGQMKCLSLDSGELIWSHDLVGDFGGKIQEFGYSASPIEHDGQVIALVGGDTGGVIAFDPADGSVVWRSEPHDISYASPIVINVDGQDQIVFFSSTEIIGLDAHDGGFLWRHPCVNRWKNNATDPIWADNNLLWVATQLEGAVRALRLRQENGETAVEEVWSNDKVKLFHWNAVRVGDYVYLSIGTTGANTLAAVAVETGQIAWRERGFTQARCLYADDKLIFLDENGQLALAGVSPERLEILSKTQLTEKPSWTVPTLVGRTLYVRDTKNIMALDLGASRAADEG